MKEKQLKKDSEAFASIWPFLRLTRLFGLPPIGNNLTSDINIYWAFTCIAILAHIFLVCIGFVHIFLGIHEGVVLSLKELLFYGHGLFNIIFMAFYTDRIGFFLSECGRIELLLRKVDITWKKGDLLFKAHILTLSLFLIELTDMGFYYYTVGLSATEPRIGFREYFEKYDEEFNSPLGNSHKLASGFILFTTEIFSDFGKMFGRNFFQILSFILARYTRQMNSVIEKMDIGTAELEKLRESHQEIVNLIQLCNDLFSPILMANFIGDIGNLFTSMFLGYNVRMFEPEEHLANRTADILEIIFQIFKIFYPAYFAALVHQEMNRTLEIVQDYPIISIKDDATNLERELRILEIERFVNQLKEGEIGIECCGYFLITKSFLISLASSLFTYELIILQFQTAFAHHYDVSRIN